MVEADVISFDVGVVVGARAAIDGAADGEVERTGATPSRPGFVRPVAREENSTVTPALETTVFTTSDATCGVGGGASVFYGADARLATFCKSVWGGVLIKEMRAKVRKKNSRKNKLCPRTVVFLLLAMMLL